MAEDKDRTGGLPAGGALLSEIRKTIINILEDELKELEQHSNQKKPGYTKMSETLRDRVQNVVLGEESLRWRGKLKGSFRLAESIMSTVSEAYDRLYDAVVDLKFKLVTPGLVGAGSGIFNAVFEVGLTLDPVLGLPYYPGSTIKGALRDALVALYRDEGLPDGKAEYYASLVMGSSGVKGVGVSSVYVADSYPVGCAGGGPESGPCLLLTGDVVTPHYYNGGEVVEKEYEAQPVPVVHLAIAPGTVYRLVIGVDCPLKHMYNIEGKNHLAEAREAVRILISKMLNTNRSLPEDPCSDPATIQEYAIALAVLAVRTLNTGLAARQAKGYNAFRPLDDSERLVTDSIVAFKLKIEPPQQAGSGGGGGRRSRPRPSSHGRKSYNYGRKGQRFSHKPSPYGGRPRGSYQGSSGRGSPVRDK